MNICVMVCLEILAILQFGPLIFIMVPGAILLVCRYITSLIFYFPLSDASTKRVISIFKEKENMGS